MAKVGRPPTPEDEQLVTAFRLMNKHVAMLDRVILERSTRDLRSVVTGPAREIPGTNVTVADSRNVRINYALERRKLVAALIEHALTTEALYPTSVRPDVPPGPYGEMELTVVSDWAKQETLRLTANAPLSVQLVLERNKLRRMERELSPKAYLQWLQTATRAAPEADRGTVPKDGLSLEEAGAVTTDDDEETP